MIFLPEGVPLIFFDGECGACNTFIQFVMERDQNKRFRFAPLQGTTARELLDGTPDLSTVVLVWEGERFAKSEAVLRVLGELGGAWSLWAIFLVVPRFIRDFFLSFLR